MWYALFLVPNAGPLGRGARRIDEDCCFLCPAPAFRGGWDSGFDSWITGLKSWNDSIQTFTEMQKERIFALFSKERLTRRIGVQHSQRCRRNACFALFPKERLARRRRLIPDLPHLNEAQHHTPNDQRATRFAEPKMRLQINAEPWTIHTNVRQESGITSQTTSHMVKSARRPISDAARHHISHDLTWRNLQYAPSQASGASLSSTSCHCLYSSVARLGRFSVFSICSEEAGSTITPLLFCC